MSLDHPRCECHSCTQSRLRQFERQMSQPLAGQQTMVPHSVMASQIDAAVLAERERCAKVAEGLDVGITIDARRIAAKIREGQ